MYKLAFSPNRFSMSSAKYDPKAFTPANTAKTMPKTDGSNPVNFKWAWLNTSQYDSANTSATKKKNEIHNNFLLQKMNKTFFFMSTKWVFRLYFFLDFFGS